MREGPPKLLVQWERVSYGGARVSWQGKLPLLKIAIVGHLIFSVDGF
jgi:hypothetical protein